MCTNQNIIEKNTKNVFGGRACARNKLYVACFVYLSFAAAKLPAEAATCVFLKKKHKMCKPINFLFFMKMHRLCCARVICAQFLLGETIPSCAMGMCAHDGGGGVTGPGRQGVPLVKPDSNSTKGRKMSNFFFFFTSFSLHAAFF